MAIPEGPPLIEPAADDASSGAQKAADELGNVDIIWRGPVVESDTGSQIEVVKSMTTMQVDGIVLAPNQKGALVDAVDEAVSEIVAEVFEPFHR